MNQENDKKESYKVLLADDEQIERMALARRLLKRFGESLVILQAVDGTEAIKLCSQEGCQIVIMDISMPEMNGVEAAEQIRRLDEGCEIIFLTAYDEFSYAKRAIAIHALDYLLKPCEEEELTAVMEEAMRRLRRRRQFEELNRTDTSAGSPGRRRLRERSLRMRRIWRSRIVWDRRRRRSGGISGKII